MLLNDETVQGFLFLLLSISLSRFDVGVVKPIKTRKKHQKDWQEAEKEKNEELKDEKAQVTDT